MLKYGVCLFVFVGLQAGGAHAQNPYTDKSFQFLSFENVATWNAVATGWNTDDPQIHLYDGNKYKGHAQYVSAGLKTGITFKTFKEEVRHFSGRKYIPFFLFDLRDRPVTQNGNTYTWALRMEDYAYTDSDTEMVYTVTRLMQTVNQWICKTTGQGNAPGIIILSSAPKPQPNIRLALELNAKGFPHFTINAFIEKVRGKRMAVLNPGIAYGFLRIANAEKETTVSAHDIVVYSKIPERIPPVAGIITLEPQTPLSHVNLLAINRGTVNIYTLDLKGIPGAENLVGKLVKLECRDQKLSITETTLPEAEKWWKLHAPRIHIPQPVTDDRKLFCFSEDDTALLSAAHIGAKAANYAFLQRHFTAYVRAGYALPFSSYYSTLRTSGAIEKIANLLSEKEKLSTAERDQRLQEIRKIIEHGMIDSLTHRLLADLIRQQFPANRIRLRSSTNCEDLAGFNGAGLYLSKGFNTTDSLEKLEKKILEIYASLWTSHAFEEREYFFINHKLVGMAILIHESFADEIANGVAITIPSEKDFSIYINTQPGDHMVTNPKHGEIPESILFATSTRENYKTESRSNLGDVFLSDSLNSLLPEFKSLICRIHKSMTRGQSGNYGIDVEFRIMRENDKKVLVVKQVRLLGAVLPE